MDADLFERLQVAAPSILAEARRGHSDGPWTCEEENSGGGLNIRDREGNCILFSAGLWKNYERISGERAIANGRLAAAAPKMFDALQTLAVASMGDPGLHANEYERQVREIAAAAIAAITEG